MNPRPAAIDAPPVVVGLAAVLFLLHIAIAFEPGGVLALGFIPARCLDGSVVACGLTASSYGLLHGSWGHLLVNALFLLAFGAPVARRLGARRFLVLCYAGSLAGAAAHFASDPSSLGPLVGASAAVSALLAAMARFVFAPGGELYSARGSAKRRALGFVVVWMGLNLAIGVFSDGIAWQAHLGGFVVGWLLYPRLARQRL